MTELNPASRTRPACRPESGGQFRRGRVDPADDLGRAVGQETTGLGEPDAAAHPLQQRRTRLGLQPGQVVADRRLRVVQLPGGRGDRPVPPDGVDDAELDEGHHP
jgi:hypothetical protein